EREVFFRRGRHPARLSSEWRRPATNHSGVRHSGSDLDLLLYYRTCGGDQLFIVNSELRIPISYDLPLVHKNLGVVPFYDGGNVYQRIGFHNFVADYTNSVGIGLRYKTPVG